MNDTVTIIHRVTILLCHVLQISYETDFISQCDDLDLLVCARTCCTGINKSSKKKWIKLDQILPDFSNHRCFENKQQPSPSPSPNLDLFLLSKHSDCVQVLFYMCAPRFCILHVIRADDKRNTDTKRKSIITKENCTCYRFVTLFGSKF